MTSSNDPHTLSEKMALFWSVLVLQVLISSALADGKDYSGSQVLRVLKDKRGLVRDFIKEKGLDVWKKNGDHFDVLVPAKIVQKLKDDLKLNKISFSTMIKNVKEAIEKENPISKTRSGRTGRLNFSQYQRLNSIHDYLDSLAQKYPKFVSVGVMGKSVENRPLKYIKISSGRPNAKIVFIDGGIHAREWVSPASVLYITRELVENRQNLPKELLDLDFYILPVLNPDGYEYSHTKDRMWRKNRSKEYKCAGADLNRNFDFKFGGLGTSSSPCEEDYRGKSAASEAETKAVQAFLTSIRRNLKAYITFHSYGQYILIPYGYDENSPAPGFNQMKKVGDEAARAIRRATGQEYTVGNTADTLYPAAGGSDDWAKAKLGIPYAFTIELRDTGRHGFILPARFILDTAKEAFEAVKVMSVAASKA